jgi:DNA polymerase-3 subunit epsilon
VGAAGDGFVVIDFETTGFSARKTDRVVEIGVVCMDHSGEVVSEWTTLVNPERDVSAGHIHGITARDVYGAPRFEEVGGLLAESLRGRVLVAHNLSFEAQFLMGEFGRLGHELQLDRGSGICTMTLASTYIPHSPRNLQACCDCCGVELLDAHSALADARATTQLLGRYISVDADFADRWAHCYAQSLHVEWPALAADPSCVKPRGAAAEAGAADTYVGRLAAHLPAVGGSGVTDSYLEVLDRALIDRILALHEMDELIGLARDLGLSRQQTDAAHRDYLEALVRQAWADGELSDAEIADIRHIAGLLGIDEPELQGSIQAAAQGVGPRAGHACSPPVGAFALEPGDRIVFTGEAPGVSREQLCEEAEALGLRPMSSVSRKTKVVVASDPDSISGKARKARERGVPVIDFAAYLRLRDRMPEA